MTLPLNVHDCTVVHTTVTMLATWPEVTKTDLIRPGRWEAAESTTCGTNFHRQFTPGNNTDFAFETH